MGVAVPEVVGGRQQAACFAQVGADRAVLADEFGVDDAALATEPEPVLAIFAVIFDGEDRAQAVRLAEREVVLAMVGDHVDKAGARVGGDEIRSEEHTSELQSLMRISYAVSCLKK